MSNSTSNLLGASPSSATSDGSCCVNANSVFSALLFVIGQESILLIRLMPFVLLPQARRRLISIVGVTLEGGIAFWRGCRCQFKDILVTSKLSFHDSAGRLAMGLVTGTTTSRLMFNVVSSVAQFEREVILECEHGGIAKAKAEGRYKGRPVSLVKALKAEGLGPTEIRWSRRAVYRVLGAA